MLAQAVDRLRKLTLEFQSKWGLWFPVPPRVGGRLPRLYASPHRASSLFRAADVIPKAVPHRWPEELMTAEVVKPVRDRLITDSLLVLDVWLPAGDLVFDFIGGRLDHVQRHDDWLSAETTSKPMGRRSAKKGLNPGQVKVEPLGGDWIRLEVHNPHSVHLTQLRKQLGTLQQRAPLSLQKALEPYGQMFLMVRERNHRTTKKQRGSSGGRQPERLSRVQIEERLCLRPARGAAVSNLTRMYARLCQNLGLPPVSP